MAPSEVSFAPGIGLLAAPQARAFVRAALAAQHPVTVADAELVITELVTNAVLHVGEDDVVLRISTLPGRVRLEVEDSGQGLPAASVASAEAMTGRGLQLVAALASTWGVNAAGPRRKVVWAELSEDPSGPGSDVLPGQTEPELDVQALLAAWSDEDDAFDEQSRLFTVDLGTVPTRLLLDAKAHVDNVARELVLAAGATAAHDTELSPRVVETTAAVIRDFAEPRRSIKEQAARAAAAGLSVTELTLTVPRSAVAAAERYLAALDELDRYAGAARMLTLQSPRVQQVFRRWYIGALVEAVRAQSRGDQPPPLRTFTEVLVDSVTALSRLEVVARQTAGLQRVGAALAGVTTPDEVAHAVVATGIEVLGASGGGLALAREQHLEVLAFTGFRPEYAAILEAAHFTDDDLPGPVVHRTGQPLWIESPEARDRLFPRLASIEPEMASTCVVPLVAGQPLGTLRFTFSRPRLFDDAERRFIMALADSAALAMQRSQLFMAERAARTDAEQLAKRLNLLMEVTAELAGAASVEDIGAAVTASATEQLGAMAARVYLLEDGGVLRSTATATAAGTQWAAGRTFTTLLADDPSQPLGMVMLTGVPLVLAGNAEIVAQFPRLEGIYDDDRTLVVVPLTVGSRRFGLLSLVFDYVISDPETDLMFVATLADATAQGIERALATSRAAQAADKLRFLADASVALSGTVDFATTVRTIAELVVPRLADWCVVQVRDGEDETGLRTVALTHVDPANVAWAEEVAQRYPPDPQAQNGTANVLRTGVSELYTSIPDELLVAGAVDDDHLALLRGLGLTSVLVVPLTGRTGTFGAITLVSAASRRHYDAEDVTFAEDLARRAALAVETVTEFQEQQGRLARVTRVAEAAQHAILAAPPARLGPVRLAARYVSAATDALVGGDLYEVVPRPGAVRLLIGDVRGKGLDAVRNATIVLGEFRAAAADLDDLADVAVQLDRRIASYLATDEDFVTALLAEVGDDGGYRIACCGHPDVLRLSRGKAISLSTPACLPLGLGARPTIVRGRLAPGDRMLMFTDGLIEARRPDRSFIEIAPIIAPLLGGEHPDRPDQGLDHALDEVLRRLRLATGSELSDDLALLALEFQPPPSASGH